ncbi:MAG: hypothetical protein CSA07_03040 [Bacteroidia bacterium]|nr:MAG: hypothetical protein CSA07_03040 [Bacteroidia bacterium]
MASRHIKFDWAIKRLLRNKANFDILEGFLTELLGFDLRIEEILESESNQQHPGDKFNRVDLLARDSQGDHILIEVQNDMQVDYFRRMLYGQAKLISERLDQGDSYMELSKVYSINIVYFPLGVGQDYIYVSDGTFRGMHLGDELGLTDRQKALYRVNRVGEIFMQYYIIKVNQFDDVAKDTLDEWIYFLKHSDIKPTFRAKGMAKAREVLRRDNMTPQERWAYDAFIKERRIRESEYVSVVGEAEWKVEQRMQAKVDEAVQQREEALQREQEAVQQREEAMRREREANIRLATRMLRYGEPIEEIARETGLSVAEVEALRADG